VKTEEQNMRLRGHLTADLARSLQRSRSTTFRSTLRWFLADRANGRAIGIYSVASDGPSRSSSSVCNVMYCG